MIGKELKKVGTVARWVVPILFLVLLGAAIYAFTKGVLFGVVGLVLLAVYVFLLRTVFVMLPTVNSIMKIGRKLFSFMTGFRV